MITSQSLQTEHFHQRFFLGLILIGLMSLAACGGGTKPLPTASPATNEVLATIEIENDLTVDRDQWVARLPLTVEGQNLHPADLARLVVYQTGGSEPEPVPSAVWQSSVRLTEAGFVGSFDLLLQDDYPAGTVRSYKVGLRPEASTDQPLLVEQLAQDQMGDLLMVDNGRYTLTIGHELEPLDVDYNGQLPKDLYVRVEGDNLWAKVIPLTHIYMNTPEFRQEMIIRGKCEPIFSISPGLPTEVDIESNSLMAVVRLKYQGQRQGLCPPAQTLINPKPTELMTADVELRFYRNSDRVEAITRVDITDTFYNHIGFSLGGIETALERPQVLFGTESHQVLQGSVWADTEELTDIPEFMQIEGDKFIFRRAGNRDGWGPFERLHEDESFNDYYVVENADGGAVLAYFPAFKRLAARQLRNEGSGAVLPLNMIGAGPSIPIMPASPIMLTQTHLGGLGGFWVPVHPGTYTSHLTALVDRSFDPEAGKSYDALAQSLAQPLIAHVQAANGATQLSTPTATATPAPTVTPTATATAVPTPAAATCAPPERQAWSAGPLPEGSLLPFFNNPQTFIYSPEQGIGVIDNSESSNYASSEMQPRSVEGPFTVSISLDEDKAGFSISGRLPAPGAEWWQGSIQLWIERWLALTIRDGTSSTRQQTYQLEGEAMPLDLRFHFYEWCGKQFSVHNGQGELLGYFDVRSMPMVDLPNGLFPDGVVHFGMYTEPGGRIELTQLSVSLP